MVILVNRRLGRGRPPAKVVLYRIVTLVDKLQLRHLIDELVLLQLVKLLLFFVVLLVFIKKPLGKCINQVPLNLQHRRLIIYLVSVLRIHIYIEANAIILLRDYLIPHPVHLFLLLVIFEVFLILILLLLFFVLLVDRFDSELTKLLIDFLESVHVIGVYIVDSVVLAPDLVIDAILFEFLFHVFLIHFLLMLLI